jgi:hypothetical protein
MLHLELLAYLSNRHAIGARTTFDREKGVVLFRRQFCPGGDQFLTEAKKLPHRMSEGAERNVVLCLERFLHRRSSGVRFRGTKYLGTKRDLLKVRRVTRSLSQPRQTIRCNQRKRPVEVDLPSVNHRTSPRYYCLCCIGENLS